jgi:serine/threonine-protein kinase
MVIDLPNGVLAKITDFGIARMPGSAVKTMTGIVLGSPRYMSPEQVVGKVLDPRSDIFSFGVVLYETLTGVAPFDGDNLTAIMHATTNVQPEPPSTLNAGVPRMLDLIVAKALAKSADDRYQTTPELALDLREVRRQLLGSSGQRPALAAAAPPPRPAAAEAATISGRYQKDPSEEQAAAPLKLATRFDSFGGTVRLAALTQQTDEFRGYISQTQKMRAYRGKVDGPPGGVPHPARDTPTIPRGGEFAQPGEQWAVGPLIVLGLLALAAVGLLVALVAR